MSNLSNMNLYDWLSVLMKVASSFSYWPDQQMLCCFDVRPSSIITVLVFDNSLTNERSGVKESDFELVRRAKAVSESRLQMIYGNLSVKVNELNHGQLTNFVIHFGDSEFYNPLEIVSCVNGIWNKAADGNANNTIQEKRVKQIIAELKEQAYTPTKWEWAQVQICLYGSLLTHEHSVLFEFPAVDVISCNIRHSFRPVEMDYLINNTTEIEECIHGWIKMVRDNLVCQLPKYVLDWINLDQVSYNVTLLSDNMPWRYCEVTNSEVIWKEISN